MNLKYAALGLISGYLAGYVLEYLQNKNSSSADTNTNLDPETTL